MTGRSGPRVPVTWTALEMCDSEPRNAGCIVLDRIRGVDEGVRMKRDDTRATGQRGVSSGACNAASLASSR